MKITSIGSFNACVFTETSTAPAQAAAAGNSCEEEPSLIQETFCRPDQTTMQQHILDDVVTLCSENGKKLRKKTFWNALFGMKVYGQALLNYFPA